MSHDPRAEWDRCWRLPLPGGRMLPVCARCSGIYPIAFTLLALQLAGTFSLAGGDPWLVLLLPLPAAFAFAGEHLGWIRGSNVLRTVSALPLGIGLSRLFVRYLQHPGDLLFWGIVIGYGSVCAGAAWLAVLRRP